MEERSRFIAPQRMGVWIVVAFCTAAVSLLVGFAAMREARLAGVVSQVEVIKLNERVAALEKHASVPAPAPAAPAAAK